MAIETYLLSFLLLESFVASNLQLDYMSCDPLESSIKSSLWIVYTDARVKLFLVLLIPFFYLNLGSKPSSLFYLAITILIISYLITIFSSLTFSLIQ